MIYSVFEILRYVGRMSCPSQNVASSDRFATPVFDGR